MLLAGLPTKMVGQSEERVQRSLIASSLALPGKRITVNRALAGIPSEATITIGRSRSASEAISAIPADALAAYFYITHLKML